MNELAWLKTRVAACVVGIGNGLAAGFHILDANITKLVSYLSLIVILLTIRKLISEWRRETQRNLSNDK